MGRAAFIVATLALGCAARPHAPASLAPLDDEGSIHVYLQPFPEDAARLALSFASIAVARADGTEVPLEVALPEAGGSPARQRLLASGRLPPGRYGAVVLRLRRATLAGDEGPVDLLVGEGPVRVDLALDLPKGAARLVRLALRPGQALDREFEFGGAFAASVLAPANAMVQVSGYCTSPPGATVAVFDRRSKEVTAVIPTGREPEGIALDPLAQRGYVALAGEDQVEVIDLATGTDLKRILLRAGDGPREVGLTPDGRVAITVNERSSTASFVDTEAGAVVERVPTGQEPWSLVMGRGGRRAYVLNRRSNSVTVLDLGNRAVAGEVPTDPEPLRADIDGAETRLYVVHRGSAYMNVYSLPDLAPTGRIFVGLGASAVRVDARNGRVYVASAEERRIQVFEPGSLLPVDAIEVPGPVSFLALDDIENALVAVMPSLRAIAFVDRTSRRVVGVADVGPEPYQAAVVRERF
jgi:YVTN family beta-propeller protein